MATEEKNKAFFFEPAHHMAAQGGCSWPHLVTAMWHSGPENKPHCDHPTCSVVCDPRIPERTGDVSAQRWTRVWKFLFWCTCPLKKCFISSYPSNIFLGFLLYFLGPFWSHINISKIFISLHFFFLTSGKVIFFPPSHILPLEEWDFQEGIDIN